MNHSEKIDLLIPALQAACASMTHPPESAENPHFHSKYADLPSVLDVIRPILATEGLALLQWASAGQRGPTIHSMVIHKSGQWLEVDALELPAAKQDPQGWCGAITYARRYMALAVCGITGDDDDGEAASRPPKPAARKQAPAATPAAPKSMEKPETASMEPEAKITAKMWEYLKWAFAQPGVTLSLGEQCKKAGKKKNTDLTVIDYERMLAALTLHQSEDAA